MIAGPIVRFRQVEADLENIDHLDRRNDHRLGWSFFTLGMINMTEKDVPKAPAQPKSPRLPASAARPA